MLYQISEAENIPLILILEIIQEAYNSKELIPDWYNKCIAQEVLKEYRYSQSAEEMLVVAEGKEM